MQTTKAVLRQVWRILRWPIGLLALLLLILFVKNLIQYPQKSRDTVAAIHAQKITMADVDGSRLPPPPDPKLVDATVEGIDANNNGIRDDVELAIFRLYGNVFALRAALLQYALVEQLFLTSVHDEASWKAIAEEESRAISCFKSVKAPLNATDLVDPLVYNTSLRREAKERAFAFTTSYSIASGQACDIR